MNEIWKDIEGYEGSYQVSNYGRIKSLGKITSHKSDIILKQSIRNTYNVITLSKNGKRKSFQVHRLVAQSFIPNNNNYSIVNHKDENPINNHVSNLEWCTQKYNVNFSKHKMRKIRKRVYSKLNEKYIFKCKSISRKNNKKYIYDYYRVSIKQLNFDCRYSSLEKAINVRNEKIKELNTFYLSQ